MIEITDKPIDVQRVIKAATTEKAGAINSFIGTVRSSTNGKRVVKLEYEAYEPMAIAEITKIITEASEKFNLSGYAVSHRTGTLLPGEIAVAIAVSTPHRKESFTACEWIIDTLKQRVPIWKKEFFENGEHWVSAHP